MAVLEQEHRTVEEILEAPASTLALIISEWADGCIAAGKSPSEYLTPRDLEVLDDGDVRTLVRVGAMHLINRELYDRRTRVESPPDDGLPANGARRNPPHPIGGRNPTAWRALQKNLCGADGALKPLLAFREDDLDHLANDYKAQREGAARKERWSLAALKALRKHKVEELSSLPAEVLAELDEHAESAWGRV